MVKHARRPVLAEVSAVFVLLVAPVVDAGMTTVLFAVFVELEDVLCLDGGLR